MTNRGGAPSDKVWAIYFLWAQEFPVSISLDQRTPDDDLPYSVMAGESREELTRLSDEEVSWLIAKKVGVA